MAPEEDYAVVSKHYRPPSRAVQHLVFLLACFLILRFPAAAQIVPAPQNTISDWQLTVRRLVKDGRNTEALSLVENRLQQFPDDLEAHGWRGRLLAWRGSFQDAEAEYRLILRTVPQDVDVLTGLSDVLLWQKKYEEALEILDFAKTIEPANPEIVTRRARVLFLLDRTSESRDQYRSVLPSDPTNEAARAALSESAGIPRHDLRIGEEFDLLSYAGNTQSQVVSLSSRWNRRWTTLFAINSYEMFGERAIRTGGGAAFRFRTNDWLRFEAGIAPPQNITSEGDVLFEYGHGFHFSNSVVRGLESSYQQRWLWYRGAQVSTFGTTQIVYLPRDWLWALTTTGARTCFPSSGCAIVPSGSTRLTFPLTHAFSGNVLYAVGSENFSQVNQIGRISAHSYGGGLRYHLAPNQDLITSLVIQKRPAGQTQTSMGMTYGIRF
jgi:tetratricopeptide (TPR) repeat protein